MLTRHVLATTILLGLVVAAPARADVRLPHIISDHAVLQRDMAVPIWGWAEPGEEVSVGLGGQTRTTKTGADGKWEIWPDKPANRGPHTLTVKGNNTLTVRDVLIGEVWLASGQSNMQWTVKDSRDPDKEQAAAHFPEIRMFEVPRKAAREPQADCTGTWKVCSPESVGNFSAAAYYFGRDLYQQLQVPIGLINSSYGGTPIEAWTSLPAQMSDPQVKLLVDMLEQRAQNYNTAKAKADYEKQWAEWNVAAKAAKAAGRKPPREPKLVHPRDEQHFPAVLFNGMIAPVMPYAIRGAIWYQGESNGGGEHSGKLYEAQLRLLVQDWRSRWGEGNFPFAWVQLPNFTTPATGWPYVRESMLKALSLPNTGMTINMDIGESNNIHPKNKQAIGRRLALWALARTYGQAIAYSGPLPAGQRVNGNMIVLSFHHANGGLTAPGGELRGFQIAGADKHWQPATAIITGSQVIVSSPKVPQPSFVRYDWANDPDGNLYNGAGLPASPFRTDRD